MVNRVVMTLPVVRYPEQMRDNVTYHAKVMGVEAFVILLHNPDEYLLEMSRKLQSEYEVVVLEKRQENFQDGIWRTEMAKVAKEKLGAKWVFTNDIDEYLAFKNPAVNNFFLSDVVGRNTPKNVIYFYRYNVLPVDSYPSELTTNPAAHYVHVVNSPRVDPLLKSKPFEEITPLEYVSKSVAGKAITSTDGLISIANGSHEIEIKNIDKTINQDLAIYHFPYFSKEQFIKDTSAKVAAIDLTAFEGTHQNWHVRLFDWLIKNGKMDQFVDGMFDKENVDKFVKSGYVSIDNQIAESIKKFSY